MPISNFQPIGLLDPLNVLGFNDMSTLMGHFEWVPEKGRREIEENDRGKRGK